jgi:hypothetical protein
MVTSGRKRYSRLSPLVIFGNSQLFKLADCDSQDYRVHKSDHQGRRCSIGPTEMPLPVRRRSVIMYGNDPNLLHLSSTFLQGHGYDVDTVCSLEDLADDLGQIGHSYELLFISHTASAAGRKAASDIAMRAGIPVYQLHTGISPDEWLEELSKLLG